MVASPLPHPRPSRTARLLAECGLVLRFACASHLARIRTLLTAGGIALGVVVLLTAASVPHAVSERQQREHATAPVFGGPDSRLLLFSESTSFSGVTITENVVQVRPGRGVVARPPGLTAIPRPGEMVISSAVAQLLRQPSGAILARRLRARVIGQIDPTALPEPDSAVVYVGSRELIPEEQTAVAAFGSAASASDQTPLLTLVAIMIVVALLLPVAVFVATAARFGVEERERRLAAMRLLGADLGATVRIAAGESLVAAVGGLLVGGVVFVLTVPLLAGAGLAGIHVFASDLRPPVGLAALVVVLVPLCSVAAALASIRRVAIEPLGVSRRASRRPRRLGWRLIAPVLGFALLAPLLGHETRLSSGLGEAEAAGGVIFVLIGVTALLPWLVDVSVRHAPDGPLPLLLAIRRLQQEEGSTGRVIGAIGLAVAGAVALSIVFGAAQSRVDGTARTVTHQVDVQIVRPTASSAQAGITALSRLPGVVAADPSTPTPLGHWYAAEATLTLRSGSPALLDDVENAAAARDPIARVYTFGYGSEARVLADLRRVLVAGAVLVLVMIGASLLIAAGEATRERRPSLAVLGAVGTRRSTVRWSLLWHTAIPVIGGLILAVILGVALGAMLVAVLDLPFACDWSGIGALLGAGAAVVAVVTGLSLPAVGRAMRPEALRVE